MNYKDLSNYIESNNNIEDKDRFHKLLDEIYRNQGDGDFHFVSSPGRVEIGGNHTDHQHGHVVAATITIDDLCVFKKSDDTKVIYKDFSFGEVVIDIADTSFNEKEINTSFSIIRGVANMLKELGYKIGGFSAVCDSRVLIGSSLSSSACFEMMIVEIFSTLYNDNKIGNTEKAKIAQYAENKYFGKASGLLDQLTISSGGLVAIDFKNIDNPKIESFDFSFDDYGYDFFVINTQGTHADLSKEYSTIPLENKIVAEKLGESVLADTVVNNFIDNLKGIRESINNDRALLRSIHFYSEDERAIKEKEAIKNKEINSFLSLINESGRSSFMYLQNVYLSSDYKHQNISLGLAITDLFLKGKGAFRIQGGGFEGTFLAIVPFDKSISYIELMESVYGPGSVIKVKIRDIGTYKVI